MCSYCAGGARCHPGDVRTDQRPRPSGDGGVLSVLYRGGRRLHHAPRSRGVHS